MTPFRNIVRLLGSRSGHRLLQALVHLGRFKASYGLSFNDGHRRCLEAHGMKLIQRRLVFRDIPFKIVDVIL